MIDDLKARIRLVLIDHKLIEDGVQFSFDEFRLMNDIEIAIKNSAIFRKIENAEYAFDRRLEDEYDNGYQDGLRDGYDDGYAVGYNDGKDGR
jgi:flagellar biosynthesis/type III secretory pathway protein FliH